MLAATVIASKRSDHENPFPLLTQRIDKHMTARPPMGLQGRFIRIVEDVKVSIQIQGGLSVLYLDFHGNHYERASVILADFEIAKVVD